MLWIETPIQYNTQIPMPIHNPNGNCKALILGGNETVLACDLKPKTSLIKRIGWAYFMCLLILVICCSGRGKLGYIAKDSKHFSESLICWLYVFVRILITYSCMWGLMVKIKIACECFFVILGGVIPLTFVHFIIALVVLNCCIIYFLVNKPIFEYLQSTFCDNTYY